MPRVPNFLWAQRKGEVFITIDCVGYESTAVSLTPNSVNFSYTLDGAKQSVSVPLFAEINVEKSRYLEARGYSLYLVKKEENSWDSLLPAGEKRSYVKVDWSRWVDSDDEDGFGAGNDFNFGDLDMKRFADMTKNMNMGADMPMDDHHCEDGCGCEETADKCGDSCKCEDPSECGDHCNCEEDCSCKSAN